MEILWASLLFGGAYLALAFLWPAFWPAPRWPSFRRAVVEGVRRQAVELALVFALTLGGAAVALEVIASYIEGGNLSSETIRALEAERIGRVATVKCWLPGPLATMLVCVSALLVAAWASEDARWRAAVAPPLSVGVRALFATQPWFKRCSLAAAAIGATTFLGGALSSESGPIAARFLGQGEGLAEAT